MALTRRVRIDEWSDKLRLSVERGMLRRTEEEIGSVALRIFRVKIFNKINGHLFQKILNATEPK